MPRRKIRVKQTKEFNESLMSFAQPAKDQFVDLSNVKLKDHEK